MPSLQALGHRWRIGSDDLGLPAALEAAGTMAWIGSVGTVFYRHWQRFDCVGGQYLQAFYTGGLVLSGMNLSVLAALIRVSLRGTVINSHPRRTASMLVGAKCCMDIAVLIFSVVSTRWAYFTEYSCEAHVESAMKTAVKGLWLSAAASFVSLAFILTPKKVAKKKADNLETSESVYSTTRKSWADRLEGISKLLGLEGHPAITSIANLFTDFFKENIDLVPSDLMVALMVLENEQKARRGALVRQVIGLGAAPPPHHPRMRTWMNTETAAHYMGFACGCYGWPMYVFSSPLATFGLLRVLARGRNYKCCTSYLPRALPMHIEDDNSLLANTTVIKMVTGLTDDDIVYATFHNKLFEIPFYVALDHKMKSVVVAIRGTLSLEDVLTDLVAFDHEVMQVDGVRDAAAHEGMLATARYIMRKLTGQDAHGNPAATGETPLLDTAHKQLLQFVSEELAREYDLVIVGHSLGAGVASVLSILLRQVPRYTNVKCFAFSPPGGLLSQSLAEYSESFICSVVLGDDIVGRLGLRSMFELKIRIFQIIQNCDVKKHEVIGNWVLNLMNRLLGSSKVKGLKQGRSSWVGDPVAEKVVERFKMDMQRAIDSTEGTIKNQCDMFPPGCIMYIDEQKATRWIGGRTSYTAALTTCDSPLFREVLLSPDMLKHHMPWHVLQALQRAKLNM